MSQEQDMSLTPISPPTTSIQLSFDTSKGGAWDDRELIRASEAAMNEFHVHHPGPGSWLDKATAALAKGQKLPGAEDYGTAWYSASLPDPTEVEAEASTSTSTSTPAYPNPQQNINGNSQPNKRRRLKTSQNKYDTSLPNPYLPSTSNSTSTSQPQRRGSPSYNPGSPPSRPIPQLDEQESDSEEEEEEEYDEDAEWDLPPSMSNYQDLNQQQYNNGAGGNDQLFPSLGVYPPGGVGKEEALGYAMTAQYWAGYWMGVAQSGAIPAQKQQVNGDGNDVGHSQDGRPSEIRRGKRRATRQVEFDLDEDDEEDGLVEPSVDQALVNGQPSNLKITKKRFDTTINGLRR
ncbi:hypothetical protein I302_104572 [Kwoniella bestiolae CBS 10118]|uniref:Uncharacterized protein n=1 Tax=Kwoniella bestiolae CBS 10118 TaxID=1296100 RepID=A0A1B9GBM5_9TREE|nr:hypothetical protein I302_03278 [Kwoniella bestiolae CBS 10118]OCF28419.1 hypothetical protein I302_03278 [Kwoniella bestiolae CBS 10118]